MALAVENGFVQPHDHVALLGIGSGINCLMLAVDWQRTLAAGGAAFQPARPHFQLAGVSPAASPS
jgi:hypothetical protein